MNTTHYPSLELCKKLTEIGFPDTLLSNGSWWIDSIPYSTYAKWETSRTVCPSVMEMLDVMPELLNIQSLDERFPNSYLDISLRSWYWTVLYWWRWTEDKQLPNALAEMVLWLVENNYISFNK